MATEGSDTSTHTETVSAAQLVHEYKHARDSVQALKKALVDAEAIQCETVKAIALSSLPSGKTKNKVRIDGLLLTIVVRPNPKKGQPTYFFRGKSDDDDVVDLG